MDYNTAPWNYGTGGYVNGSRTVTGTPAFAQPQVPQQNGFNWVQGEAAAKSWPVPPNSTVLLMDSEEQKFYLKTVDASGMPHPLRIFSFKEITGEKKDSSSYVTREEFEAFRNELLYGRVKKDHEGKKNEPTV